jgi:hypothetical protein
MPDEQTFPVVLNIPRTLSYKLKGISNNHGNVIGFVVLTALTMRNITILNVTPYGLVGVLRRFGRTYSPHLQAKLLIGLIFDLEDGSSTFLRNT